MEVLVLEVLGKKEEGEEEGPSRWCEIEKGGGSSSSGLLSNGIPMRRERR
jgi:hypothetical protein